MSAVLEAPLASAMVLLTLPSMPTEPPYWADSDLTFDERDKDGTAGICWRRTVETEVGDLLIAQWVFVETDGTVNVSPAFWDSGAAEFELTAEECLAMGAAMFRVSAHVQIADHAAMALAGAMGDPWVTVGEVAELVGGEVASVKVGRVSYVRAADLPCGES